MAQGIHTLYKYKGQTQELQGISFRIGKDRFKGSQIDRNFSLGNLQKALAAMRQNRDITAWLSPNERKKALLIKSATRQSMAPELKHQVQLSLLIQALLKPVESEGGGVPYELTDAYRRKKKKNRCPSL